MAVYPLLTEKQTFVDANGNLLSGGKLFVYAANTQTKVTSYAETDGISANSNPIVLNSRGEVPNGLYVSGGIQYKLVLAPSTDTDPPTSPIWTRDDLEPLGYVAQSALSEWQSSGATATQTGATTFTVSGDQRGTFQIGRRVRAVITAAPQLTYGTVSAAVFGAGITTVTLSPLSTNLDSGMTGTIPDVGLLQADNPSVPELTDSVWRVIDNADKTKKYAVDLSRVGTGTTVTRTIPPRSLTEASRDLLEAFATASGTNTYTATSAVVPLGAYVTNGFYLVRITNGNTSGTCTLNIDALGAVTITRQNGGALLIGDIVANQYCLFHYDGANFVLLNPSVVVTTKFVSSNQTITSGAALSPIPHGLPGTPTKLWYGLVNTSPEYGWNGEILIQAFGPQDASATVARGATAWADATNVYVQYGSGAAVFNVHQKTGTPGLTSAATNTNWRLRVYAEL